MVGLGANPGFLPAQVGQARAENNLNRLKTSYFNTGSMAQFYSGLCTSVSCTILHYLCCCTEFLSPHCTPATRDVAFQWEVSEKATLSPMMLFMDNGGIINCSSRAFTRVMCDV